MTFNPFILHALYSITSQIKHPNCLPPWSQERNRDSRVFRWKISKDKEGREKSEKSPQRCPWQFILSKGNFLKCYKAREMRGKFIHVFEMKKRGPNMQNCIMFLIFFSLSLCFHDAAFSIRSVYFTLLSDLALLVKVMWADDIEDMQRIHILKCDTRS